MKKSTVKKTTTKKAPRLVKKLQLTPTITSNKRAVPEVEVAGEEFMAYIKANLKQRDFETPADIIYQGHVPLAAYLVCDGTLEFYRGKRHVKTVNLAYVIVGANELFHKKSYPFTVRIKTQTKVYILSRSVLLDAIARGFLAHLKKVAKGA